MFIKSYPHLKFRNPLYIYPQFSTNHSCTCFKPLTNSICGSYPKSLLDRIQKPSLDVPVPPLDMSRDRLIARKPAHNTRHIYNPVLLPRAEVDRLLLYRQQAIYYIVQSLVSAPSPTIDSACPLIAR